MNKLLTSLVSATIAGTFSLSAMAADAYHATPATPDAAATSSSMTEKPANAPKKHVSKKKASAKHHTAKYKTSKPHEAGAPAMPDAMK